MRGRLRELGGVYRAAQPLVQARLRQEDRLNPGRFIEGVSKISRSSCQPSTEALSSNSRKPNVKHEPKQYSHASGPPGARTLNLRIKKIWSPVVRARPSSLGPKNGGRFACPASVAMHSVGHPLGCKSGCSDRRLPADRGQPTWRRGRPPGRPRPERRPRAGGALEDVEIVGATRIHPRAQCRQSAVDGPRPYGSLRPSAARTVGRPPAVICALTARLSARCVRSRPRSCGERLDSEPSVKW